MRKLSKFALAGAAVAALAGAAVAADQSKRLTVPLADGSVVAVDYVGEVAPKVRVIPPRTTSEWLLGAAMPDIVGLDHILADMQRRHAELIRTIEAMTSRSLQPGGPGFNVASAGGMPQGSTSVSVVSVSNGDKTCTRTTEVVSQGAGKPPKVTTKLSGECGPRPAQGPSPAGLNHT